MRLLRITWGIFINLIALFVVFVVFSRFHDPFQVTAIAILGMIYVTIRSIAIGRLFQQMEFGRALQIELNDLRHALGYDPRDLHEADEVTRPLRTRAWIDIAFLSIIQIFCTFKILIPE